MNNNNQNENSFINKTMDKFVSLYGFIFRTISDMVAIILGTILFVFYQIFVQFLWLGIALKFVEFVLSFKLLKKLDERRKLEKHIDDIMYEDLKDIFRNLLLVKNEIFEFVKANARLDKNEIKETIQNIVKEAILEHHIKFSQNELDIFSKLLELANLNSRPTQLLLTLLLLIKERKNL